MYGRAKPLPCDCQNDWQDKRYGVGKRLHNPCKSKISNQRKAHRCTVCAAVKEVE